MKKIFGQEWFPDMPYSEPVLKEIVSSTVKFHLLWKLQDGNNILFQLSYPFLSQYYH